MATLKCKYCGGNVEQFPGNALGICCACGSKMTLPRVDDEHRASAHNFGNYLRRNGNFEKALAAYQRILQEDPEDAEASWCSVLCRYRIQYERTGEDGPWRPKSNLKEPGSIFQDGDYLAALANSEGAVHLQYEKEAANIAKLWKKSAPKPTQATAPKKAPADSAQLMKQAFSLLEQRQWEQANAVFDQVLALQPENAMAWLGKLLAEQKCRKPKNLPECIKPFDDSENYQKAIQYADEKLKKTLLACTAQIKRRYHSDSMMADYQKACALMNQASTQEQYKHAGAMFAKISGFRDSEQRARECAEHAATAHKDAAYLAAVSAANNAKTAADYRRAAELLRKTPGWRDTDFRLAECEEVLRRLEAKKAAPKKKKNWFKSLCITTAILAIVCTGFYFFVTEYLIPEKKYKDADALYQANNRGKAIAAFQELGGYKDASDRALQIQQEWYDEAEGMLARMEYARAAAAFGGLKDYGDSAERSNSLWDSIAKRQTLTAGGWYTIGMTEDQSAIGCGINMDGQCNVEEWNNLLSISAGWSHTIGLKTDGTVIAAGYHGDDRCDVENWENIVAIDAGQWHTVGLQTNGLVVGTGCDNDGRLDFSLWNEIADVRAGRNHTVGLKADGSVVAVGANESGQCDVGAWRGITAIAAGGAHTVGLKADGTVVAVGSNAERQCQVGDWTDIVAIAAGYYHTIGLKADGTVVAAGWDQDGQCAVNKWKNIVAIAAGGWHTVGLKADGTVISIGRNYHGQCDTQEWAGIQMPAKTVHIAGVDP